MAAKHQMAGPSITELQTSGAGDTHQVILSILHPHGLFSRASLASFCLVEFEVTVIGFPQGGHYNINSVLFGSNYHVICPVTNVNSSSPLGCLVSNHKC